MHELLRYYFMYDKYYNKMSFVELRDLSGIIENQIFL